MEDKKELCLKVRKLCEEQGLDFLFIVEDASTHEGHLKDVVTYHFKNEPVI